MAWSDVLSSLRQTYGGRTPEESVRKAVERALTQASVSHPPTPLDLVASFCGVAEIRVVAMPGSGRLVPLPSGDYVVQVSKSDSPGRRRFSVAHEICHTFFNRVRRARRSHDDRTTGLFAGKGEEYLCDAGAAHMLLHPSWVRELAGGDEPSLARLFLTAQTCETSIQATARQIATLGVWQCSFVIWEPGYRKSERPLLDRMPLPGLESIAPVPTPKLRAAQVYAAPGQPFLPWNTSVSEESSVAEAFRTQDSASGVEEFAVGPRYLAAECESRYVGYRRDGEWVHRILSLLRWIE